MKNCVFRLTYLSYIVAVQSIAMLCVGERVSCSCVGVSVSRKKNFPIGDAHFGERSYAGTPP